MGGGSEEQRWCGSDLLLSLPDDVLGLLSAHLRPADLCALALCCRRLRAAVVASDKAWLAQCLNLLPSASLLAAWRASLPSYAALCRFLACVRPLLGIWVHQNPELGNVVCVAWGPAARSASLLALRVIPQELSPAGLEAGPLLWAPVFEITPSHDGPNPCCLFLHGRDGREDSVYPASLLSVDPKSNVLLLEVDVRKNEADCTAIRLQPAKSFAHGRRNLSSYSPAALSMRRSASLVAQPQLPVELLPPPQFSKLAFGERRRLLDLVAAKVRQVILPDLDNAPLFPTNSEEEKLLEERRLHLIRMHRLSGGGRVDWQAAEILRSIANRKGSDGGDGKIRGSGKKRSFFSAVKQIMGRSSSQSKSSLVSRNSTHLTNTQNKHVPLGEFLKSGDTVGLTLRGMSMKLTSYRAWPNMHDNRFALYKLQLQEPKPGNEYAGLWGGTFGWPPGKTSVDKPGKALFFLLLSYEEIDGHLLLIATKILEGTHYVLHPNGSAMFTVKVDEPSLEIFPWETDGDDVQLEVKHAYAGEGIANGYGFRYPGSKPGSLFEMQNGHLSFVWKESKAVLTLQRLDLEELLRKGEPVPPLPPIANFAYLTKSFSNVFAGYPCNSGCSPSPR